MALTIKILKDGDSMELGELSKAHLVIDNRGSDDYSFVLKDRLGNQTGIIERENLSLVLAPYLDLEE